LVRPGFFLCFCLVFLFSGCSNPNTANIGQANYNQPDETAAVQKEAVQELKKEDVPEDIIHNPFLTDEENNEFLAAPSAIPIEGLELSAVVYSQGSLISRAVINGRVVKVGDVVDNKTIFAIEPEAVRLKDEQGEYIIRMKNK